MGCGYETVYIIYNIYILLIEVIPLYTPSNSYIPLVMLINALIRCLRAFKTYHHSCSTLPPKVVQEGYCSPL